MVEVLNISSVSTNTSSKSNSVSDVVAPSYVNNQDEAQTSKGYVSSSIRVDNLQNVAILEYKSSETGEIKEQYPTQKQIEAFKSAQKLQDQRMEQASSERANAAQGSFNFSISSGESSAPKVEAPTPATTTVVSAPDVQIGSEGSDSGSESTSILV